MSHSLLQLIIHLNKTNLDLFVVKECTAFYNISSLHLHVKGKET